MFFNSTPHAMDAKKRLFVPKRFQKGLTRDEDGTLYGILSRGQDGCLFLFSQPGFDRAIEKLDTEGFTSRAQRRAQRALFAHADQVTLDAAGRILIPESLRAFAGLEKEVVLAGAGARAEIWSKERWEAQLAEDDVDFDEIDQILREGSRDDDPRGGARDGNGRA
jgi:MraZ protein